MRGTHHIKSLAVTQTRVTLSSAEAELGALVKAASETIGITQMTEGLGRKVSGYIFVDSSAALAVVNRKGCGKLRHVRVGQLWVQQLAEEEEMDFIKVIGEENPAYLCTKHLAHIRIEKVNSTHQPVPQSWEGRRRVERLSLSRRCLWRRRDWRGGLKK